MSCTCGLGAPNPVTGVAAAPGSGRDRGDAEPAIGAVRSGCGGTTVNGALAGKTIIVLGAFPVLVHAIFTVTTMVLGLMMPQIAELAGDWSEMFHKTVIVVIFLVAVRASFGLCRRMWPETTVKS
jgi:hypothetical protein